MIISVAQTGRLGCTYTLQMQVPRQVLGVWYVRRLWPISLGQGCAGKCLVDKAALIQNTMTRTGIQLTLDYTVKLKLNGPDIAIIPGFTDYPALVVHRNFEKDGADPLKKPIGTDHSNWSPTTRP